MEERNTEELKLEELEMDLSLHDTNFKVAEETIVEDNIKLLDALTDQALCRENIQKTEAMIDIGVERKNVLTKAIENIQKKKRKTSS